MKVYMVSYGWEDTDTLLFANEEDAKKKVYDNLVATNQIKPADYVKIEAATEISESYLSICD